MPTKDFWLKFAVFAVPTILIGFLFYSFLYATEVELLIVDKDGKTIRDMPRTIVEFRSLDEDHVAVIPGNLTPFSSSLKSGDYMIFVFLGESNGSENRKVDHMLFSSPVFLRGGRQQITIKLSQTEEVVRQLANQK